MQRSANEEQALINISREHSVCGKLTPNEVHCTPAVHNKLVLAADESDYSIGFWIHALFLALMKPLRRIREGRGERVFATAELPEETDIVAVTIPSADESHGITNIGLRGEL